MKTNQQTLLEFINKKINIMQRTIIIDAEEITIDTSGDKVVIEGNLSLKELKIFKNLDISDFDVYLQLELDTCLNEICDKYDRNN